MGTLLKTETVSLLLGAGASVDCGGQLIGSVPLPVERMLNNQGITGTQRPRLRRWLRALYLAVRYAGGDDNTSVSREAILARREALDREIAQPLRVNLETVLATLHRWRSALPETGGRLRIDGALPVDIGSSDLDECIRHVTNTLASACDLPTEDKQDGLATYGVLVRKLLTRPLNLKRVNVFTLNYDTLVEQAADATGVVLLDGFVGTQSRVLRPESYDQDLYFPAETTEGRVHRFDRVLHLYKLHGSITWTGHEPTLENPYGVSSTAFTPQQTQPLLIYPTPAKYGETLGLPYSELFRRFADAIAQPQSVLFVIGYGFGDEHVNAIIRQALAVPSFTLVIVDPSPKSAFVTKLREQQDRRVWVAEGPTLGTLAGFVSCVLPDLQDEEIRKKVLATRKALGELQPAAGGAPHGE
ncbi:SIR2 family protein [Candidatus Palauibacter sp.]|uniref:SIR2 family protein n=1 Tax=Candidatus Palauibacter sp. TaxID=3101350 RepID=UPI003B5C15B3